MSTEPFVSGSGRRPDRTRPFLALAFAGGILAMPASTETTSGQSVQDLPSPPPVLLLDEEDARIPLDAADYARPEGYVSGDTRIDAILSDHRWYTPTVTYSFYSASVFGSAYYGTETGVREVSDGIKRNVRAIMAWCASVSNLNLVEVTETSSTVGQIRFLHSDNPSYAYAYYPTTTAAFHVAGDIHLNPTFDRLGDTNGFQNPAGEHGYATLIHEVGHALGLKHPHAGWPTLPASEDNHTYTVMSYGFTGRSPGTPMPYDLLALQYLYGVRPYRTGNDTYVFSRDTIDQFTHAGQLHLDPSTLTKQTIWDAGGTNAVDLSALAWNASGYRLDLKPFGWLSTWADYQGSYLASGTALGPGVAIQTIVNSSSDDTIFANDHPNVFGGYTPGRQTGRDTIQGAGGDDVIDLSSYSPSDVRETPSGYDLVLDLGLNRTITLRDYYTAAVLPRIVYGPVRPPNQPPVAAASATPTSGTAPLSVQFSSAGSSDPDGTVQSYFWAFGDGATSAAPDPVHTYVVPGAYTATLSVTDDRGATATKALAVSVQAAPVVKEFWVAQLQSYTEYRPSGPAPVVVLTVVSGGGQPVAGAKLTARWTGLLRATQVGTTGSDGRIEFRMKSLKQPGVVGFEVASLVKDWHVYNPDRGVALPAAIVVQ